MKIEDETGKTMKALTVFTHAIRYLKDDLMSEVNKSMMIGMNDKDIHWVLTVPAIWEDASKQFMREAAEQVKQLIMLFLFLYM